MAIQKIPNTLIADNAVTASKIANGTLTADDIAANSITAAKLSASTSPTFGGIDVTGTITASGNITGTLATAAQPNITSLGTLTDLDVQGDTARIQIRTNDPNDTELYFWTRNTADTAIFQSSIKGIVDGGMAFGTINTANTDTTERLRISATGNVGIGTSSPSAKLELNVPTGDGLLIKSADISTIKMKGSGTVTDWGFATTNLAAGDFGIYASNSVGGDPISAGTAKMYFTSTGNVGIGTTSPAQSLDTTGKIRIRDGGNTTVPSIQMGASGVDGLSLPTTNTVAFITNSAERMRIDSSGNIGIGLTAQSTNKLEVFGNIQVNASYGKGFLLNDNNKITRENGGMAFTTNSSERWRFNSSGHFTPAQQHTYDIGGVNAEVRNIYTQGLYVGGSAAANKLDDYEEGTWTPTFSGASLSTATGFYTKIGDQVTVHYKIVTTGGLPGSTTQVRINDLPFSSAGNNVGAGSQYVTYYNVSNSSLGSIVQASNNYIRFVNINTGNFDYLLMGELEVTSNNSITLIGTFTYRT